jgi:hypothetical protein
MTDPSPAAVVEQLVQVTNAHDLNALVACFTDDYRNETPAHPGRSFVGREQVRANWSQIFAAVPDVESELLSVVVHGDTVWSEMEMRGTRRDGVRHLLRGVIIFGVHEQRIAHARFYLEPVDDSGTNVAAAVHALTTGEA